MKEPFETIWQSAKSGGFNIFTVAAGIASIGGLLLAFMPATPVIPKEVSIIWLVIALYLLVLTLTVMFDAALRLAAKDPWQSTSIDRVRRDGDAINEVTLLCRGSAPPPTGTTVIIECCIDGFETQVASGHVARVQRDRRFLVRVNQVFSGRRDIAERIASGQVPVTDLRLGVTYSSDSVPLPQALGTSEQHVSARADGVRPPSESASSSGSARAS